MVTRALVQHYRQSIHHPTTASSIASPYFVKSHSSSDENNHNNRIEYPIPSASSVLQLWLNRLATYGCADIHRLLGSYLELVRPLLLPPNVVVVEEAASVLTHFELLIAHRRNHCAQGKDDSYYCSLQNRSNDDNVKSWLVDLLRILCTDITFQIQNARQLLAKCDSENDDDDENGDNGVVVTTQNGDQEQRRELRYALTTKTVIPMLIRLSQHTYNTLIELDSQPETERNRPSSSNWMQAQAQFAITLLAFHDEDHEDPGVMGPRQIFTDCVNRIEDILQFTSGAAAAAAAAGSSCRRDHRTKNMQWENVELTTEEWDPCGISSKAARLLWGNQYVVTRNDEEGDSKRPDLDSTRPEWSICKAKAFPSRLRGMARSENNPNEWILQLAKAARAHFFGRDLYTTTTTIADVQQATASDTDGYREILEETQQGQSHTRNHLSHLAVVPIKIPLQSRLHLGRTVVEERHPYEKAYQEIPSRVYVICQFMSFLPNEKVLDDECLNELWPIVYELLSANREVWVALGACCLCKLWQCWDRTEYGTIAHAQVVDNLYLLVHSAIKTSRDGAVLALLGVAEQVLLDLLPKGTGELKEQQKPRLKSLQQWLTILNQNQTQRLETSWGCLVGGVLPNLHSLVEMKMEVAELGRLGLMVCLPLIQMEDMSQGSLFASSSLTNEVQWLAVLVLSNLFLVAPSFIPRHGGKIMSALVVCLMGCEVHNNDDRIYYWADQVSVQALTICGERGQQLLDHIIVSKTVQYWMKKDKQQEAMYNDALIAIAQQILERANK